MLYCNLQAKQQVITIYDRETQSGQRDSTTYSVDCSTSTNDKQGPHSFLEACQKVPIWSTYSILESHFESGFASKSQILKMLITSPKLTWGLQCNWDLHSTHSQTQSFCPGSVIVCCTHHSRCSPRRKSRPLVRTNIHARGTLDGWKPKA